MDCRFLRVLITDGSCFAGILQPAGDTCTVIAALGPPPQLRTPVSAGAAPAEAGSACHCSRKPCAALLMRPRTATNTAMKPPYGLRRTAHRQTLQRRSQHRQAPLATNVLHQLPCIPLATWQAVTAVEHLPAGVLPLLMLAGRAPATLAGKLCNHIRMLAMPRHLSRHAVWMAQRLGSRVDSRRTCCVCTARSMTAYFFLFVVACGVHHAGAHERLASYVWVLVASICDRMSSTMVTGRRVACTSGTTCSVRVQPQLHTIDTARINLVSCDDLSPTPWPRHHL